MNRHVLTAFGAAVVCAAGLASASAQTYSTPSSSAYPTQQSGYPMSGRPTDPLPDFDQVDDEQGSPNTAARGPVMSPDDPRYGRPANYSNQYSNQTPQGPVMSPDDPRYGRPANYSSQTPQGPVMSPDDPRYGRPAPPPVVYGNQQQQQPGYAVRPPDAVGSIGPANGAPQQPNAPVQLSALPPEDQPEADQGGEKQLPPNLQRQEVNFVTKEPAGTVVVDTSHTYLYYVLGNNRAIRYGVRVGRDGFRWSGVQKISRKAEWPDWHPPAEMIDRQPYLPRFMAGGPGNPLGARAMYLGSTEYRIHGTNQPSTIGHYVSSGCIGMLNEDVSDLFDRVKVGTRVVVLPGSRPADPSDQANAAPDASASVAQAPPTVPGTQPTSVAPLPPPVTIR